MFDKERIILLFIVLFGLCVRLIGITENPPSLNWDEISHGYNAYSIFKTGQDEWGQTFPLANFRAYGDYPLPLNLYITTPSIAVFGLNELGIRLPHAILGTLTILSAFFLAKGLKLGKATALLVALFVAIDPWTLFPSRAVFQSNLASFSLITSAAFFLHRKSNKWFLPVSVILACLSLYSYHNTRIFVPLLMLVAAIIWVREWKAWINNERVVFILSVALAAIFISPIPFILSSAEGIARSRWVFLIDDGSLSKIGQMRQSADLPEVVERLIFNKYTLFISEASANYISYFSPQFLFLSGGTQYQFSVPGKGMLYPVNLPFFYIGLFILIFSVFKRKRKEEIFILGWLVLGLIPASVTQGEFHVIRATTIIPVPQLLVAIGLVKTILFFRSRTIQISTIGIYSVALLYFIEGYVKEYIGPYKMNYSWAWQYGYKEAILYMKQNYDNYDQIIMTKKYGEPHAFILFHWPWDPEKYRNDPNLIRFGQSDWFWVDRFDKFYFVNDWQIPGVEDGSPAGEWKMESGGGVPTDGRTLLITSPGNYPPGWNKIETIDFLDGKPAFEILEKI